MSTTVVVGYALFLLLLLLSFSYLGLMGHRVRAVFELLFMPLALPDLILRFLWPPGALAPSRMPIEHVILLVGWFFAFNIVVYYIPVRWFLERHNERTKLP